ncbi:MAG: hypothetical protein IPJ57_04575 [Gemmatimonadetes bacterium]|nr:hypothetical protein [Gemmatimonadota bacterium]MBP9201263.1 hypothetical protein [Gemmatimonadales bacterium]
MRLARLVLPALRWRRETGFHHEHEAIDAALALGVGGFILFGVPGARADEVAALTARIRARAGRPLLLGADLERGAGQQARGLTPVPPPAALASLEDEAAIAWAGRVTARDALAVGLNWIFAPVADLDLEPENPIVQTRAFGADPARVGRQVAAWVAACQAEGALACAKHYPGHGRTRHDSHDRLPTVDLPLAALTTSDLVPFASAVAAGVGSVMTSHVAFPRWDPAGVPATRSPVILGHLREALGFQGLVVTDAFIMSGAQAGITEAAAAVASIAAGCDILLYPGDLAGTIAALDRAAADGTLPADRVAGAMRRYGEALARVSHAPGTAEPDPAGAAALAGRLLARGARRGELPPRLAGVELAVVDDDQGGWYAPGPSDIVRRALAARGIVESHGGARVVLAFAEPRAAKGRAGFGPEAWARLAALVPGAALVVLFAHPRLLDQVPEGCPVLLAWHRQPLMQQAVAGWIAERLAPVGAPR